MIRRIIVTGSAGLLGRHVCRRLFSDGHDITGIDLTALPDAEWPQVKADLTDLGVAFELIRNADVVVHIASIPRPSGLANAEVFRVNTALNYNVTEAAALSGARRFLYASSISILGYPFGRRFLSPRYLPIDAEHPAAPQDSYGLSKWLGEEVVDAAVRRGAFSAVTLRMPWIQTPDSFGATILPRRQTPEAARDLWAYLDARDAAEGFSAALSWTGSAHLRVYLSALDSYAQHSSNTLVAEAFPEVEMRKPIDGHASLIDTEPAARLLGFRASHSWRDYDLIE
ncbi:MAG: nucleoside-diphosphate-sugar epimerase [Rhodobacteraceae bacterium HLUCCA12]|nr:MAG: nucleoside-diphosphate-sugar epimerase [Rhodobacteraceae bacterium HLUCCA12]